MSNSKPIFSLVFFFHSKFLYLLFFWINKTILFFFSFVADIVILVSVIILVGLFSLQHYGPDKVGWLFAPIVLLWFLLIGGIGIFNIFKHDKGVLRAFSPLYIFRYFRRRGKNGWISLGGIMLSITGKKIYLLKRRKINRVGSLVFCATFQLHV